MSRSQCLGLMKGDLIKITKIWEEMECGVIVGVVLNYDEGQNQDPFGHWGVSYSTIKLLCEGVVKEVFVEEEDEIKLISPGTVMNLDMQI